jgi:hypothetical protein
MSRQSLIARCTYVDRTLFGEFGSATKYADCEERFWDRMLPEIARNVSDLVDQMNGVEFV